MSLTTWLLSGPIWQRALVSLAEAARRQARAISTWLIGILADWPETGSLVSVWPLGLRVRSYPLVSKSLTKHRRAYHCRDGSAILTLWLLLWLGLGVHAVGIAGTGVAGKRRENGGYSSVNESGPAPQDTEANVGGNVDETVNGKPFTEGHGVEETVADRGAPPRSQAPEQPPLASPPESEADLYWREVRRGILPGERYVRIVRPQVGKLKRVEPGHLMATERTLVGRSWVERSLARVRRFLFGRPLTTADLPHERLSKVKALAVFASDAVSSSAYATDEILLALAVAGTAAIQQWTMPVAFAIAVLLAIVATSYRQTIRAYPQGGGSYIVTKDNLGTIPSLIAAASLLTDYVLTVAVSISSGVANIASAVPLLLEYRVELAVAFIVIIALVNLRGVRESGTIFAAPTYLFIFSILTVLGVGGFRLLTGQPPATPVAAPPIVGVEPITIFLVLHAFSSGCAALTGTEAISDGVPAFKPPEWKNARVTLAWMAAILGVLFLGISFLAYSFHIVPTENETVVSQVARAALGISPGYYVVQVATMLILVLAANTSFSDFPRLSWFLARDRFMPHQFSFRGDRLAFSTGIIALAGLATILVIVFRAETHLLIPLYAIGVFVSFTLSQSSMVRRWWVRREPGWRQSMIVNAIGAVSTGIVAIVVAITKFPQGAWIVLIIIPSLVLMLQGINHHYQRVAKALSLKRPDEPLPTLHTPFVIVPVEGLHRGTLYALAYARSIASRVVAVMVTDDVEAAENLKRQWEEWGGGVPLVILESPYRNLIGPLLAYIDAVHARQPESPLTVVLPEFVPRHWWEFFLHNQTALRLKLSLFFRPNTAVVDVPYHLPE